MPRQKVPDDKRQRIAQACKGCQHRKQKCDGQKVCSGCQKRGHRCDYDSQKKRKTEKKLTSFAKRSNPLNLSICPPGEVSYAPIKKEPKFELQYCSDESDSDASEMLLHDYTFGIDQYIRGPTTSKFLENVKNLVKCIHGPCPFTQDENATVHLTSVVDRESSRPPTLPSREVAGSLIDAASRQSSGFIEIIDSRTMSNIFNDCYSGADVQSSPNLCLLYLILASGSKLAAGFQVTSYTIRDATFPDNQEYAEAFFEAAKGLLSKLANDEHPEFWTVQAWTLMASYSIQISMWDAADRYIGLAVRAAYALRLHLRLPRSPTAALAQPSCEAMENLWEALFVLDAFVAAFLGRPEAISQDQCWPTSPRSSPNRITQNHGLNENVMVAQAIRKILKMHNPESRLTYKEVRSLLDNSRPGSPCRESFEAGQAVNSLTVLRTQLFYNYAEMLLTRQSLLRVLKKQNYSNKGWNAPAKSCISAALGSIEAVHCVYSMSSLTVYDAMWWPFLSEATLVVLTSQLTAPYTYNNAHQITRSFDMLEACVSREPCNRKEFDRLSALRHTLQTKRRISPWEASLDVSSTYLDSSHGGFDNTLEPKICSFSAGGYATLEEVGYYGPHSRQNAMFVAPARPLSPMLLSDQTLQPISRSGPSDTDAYGNVTLPSILTMGKSGFDTENYMHYQQNGHQASTTQPELYYEESMC